MRGRSGLHARVSPRLLRGVGRLDAHGAEEGGRGEGGVEGGGGGEADWGVGVGLEGALSVPLAGHLVEGQDTQHGAGVWPQARSHGCLAPCNKLNQVYVLTYSHMLTNV